GRTKGNVPAPGKAGCPVIPNATVGRSIADHVDETLWVISTALGEPSVKTLASPAEQTSVAEREPATPPPDVTRPTFSRATSDTLSRRTRLGSALALSSVVLFVLVIIGSARLARSRITVSPRFVLTRLPPYYLLALSLVALSLVFALAGGAYDAYLRI